MAGTTTSISQRLGTRRRRSIPVAIAVVALGLSACGSDDFGDASADTAASSGEESTQFATNDAADAPANTTNTAPSTGGAASAGLPINDFDRDIITSVHLTMETSDVRETADDVRRLTATNGGAVFQSDLLVADPADDGSVPGGGQIVIKIPPQDLDRLVTDLDGIGVVTRLSQDSEDVTEQLVDVEIRIRQAEQTIERIELLLQDATELNDIFTIETDLAARQVAVERLRASQRNTENLVSLATLTVQIDYRSPAALVAAQDPSDGIGDAFSDGWGAFIGAVFALGYVLALAAPFLIVGLLALAAAWLLGRRWARQAARRREQQRQAADRVGPTIHGATTGYVAPAPAHGPSATPPPPHASQRLDGPAPKVDVANVGDVAATEGSTLVEHDEAAGPDTSDDNVTE